MRRRTSYGARNVYEWTRPIEVLMLILIVGGVIIIGLLFFAFLYQGGFVEDKPVQRRYYDWEEDLEDN